MLPARSDTPPRMRQHDVENSFCGINNGATPLATNVKVSQDTLSVQLADGRSIAVPLAWYPRLSYATKEERNTWRLIAGGRGIHWPAIDEDVSVANLLAG